MRIRAKGEGSKATITFSYDELHHLVDELFFLEVHTGKKSAFLRHFADALFHILEENDD